MNKYEKAIPGREWLIHKDAVKPADARAGNGRKPRNDPKGKAL